MASLKKGAEGDEVTQLQGDLATLGYPVEADGKFGPKTHWAVTNVQAMFGYDVDGIVGPATAKLVEAQKSYGWNAAADGALSAALKAQGLG